MDTVSIEFDPLAQEQRRDPFDLYARARREQPVFYAPAYDFWVVTRYDDVLRVVKDDSTFSSADALRSTPDELPPEVQAVLAEGWPEMPVIVDTDPPLHTRIRGLVIRAFTPRRVAEMEPRIVQIATQLLDSFAADGSADLIERFAWPLPLNVIGDLLGVPRADLPQLRSWGNDWLSLFQPAESVDQQLRWARGVVAMQRYFVRALEEREREPRDDLLGALAASRKQSDPPLSLVDAAGVGLDLVVAGHVTVTRALGSALVLLLREPAGLEQISRDPQLVPAVVEEVLRLESPAQGLFRRTTREVELGGVRLPAGARVMVHFGSANRDEQVFADADRFCPARPDARKHIAFGHGIHFCIGAPLARLELQVALPLLCERLPNLRFPPGVELEYEDIFFARGLARLPLEWDA